MASKKKLLISLCLLAICGCQPLSKQTTQTSTNCPDKPKTTLNSQNVTQVSFNSQNVKESGQVSLDKSVGYAFNANSGQKLSYRTTDDICIWLYTPDNQLLSNGNLPQAGKYTLQVSVPKGSTTFNLEMSLGSLQTTSNISPSSQNTQVTQKTQQSLSSNETSNNSSSTNTEASDLSEEEAVAILKRWYDAKPQIFAPPFNTNIVDELTTGNLHYNTIKTDGSIDWLRSHDSYYTYNYSRISNNIVSFSNTGRQPAIVVNIQEELYLHSPRGIDNNGSGSYQGKFIYFFDKDNGVWKISDYKKVN